MGNFWNNNYIEYESDGNKNKNLSIKEYLKENRPYLKDTITDLQKTATLKVQLTLSLLKILMKSK